MLLYFISFAFLPLADVIAIGFSAPLMLIVLCRVVLSERFSVGTSLALFIGLFGVLIILQPSASVFQASALLPLMAAMCLSVYMLLLKMLSPTETASSLIFYVPIAGMLVSGVALPWVGKAPTLSDLGLFAIMGIVGGIALFLRNEAYSRAPAFSLVPFEYTGVIWAALFGFFVFGDSVSSNLIMGSGILVITNIYIMWKREARKIVSPEPV
jgi:drug/metabolite transporter (DMT)-like permease